MNPLWQIFQTHSFCYGCEALKMFIAASSPHRGEEREGIWKSAQRGSRGGRRRSRSLPLHIHQQIKAAVSETTPITTVIIRE